MHGDSRTVDALPKCDFCNEPAIYDGRTTSGPWANMCLEHYQAHGVGTGLGRGQRLWLSKVKHAPGECPLREQPMRAHQQTAPSLVCSVCGKKWFSPAIETINLDTYCPVCLRDCFPYRENGPFTFGDVLEVRYPNEPETVYLARVGHLPEDNCIGIRFEYADFSECEDVQLACDGFGVWWDVDNEVEGVLVKHAALAQAKQYEAWREGRVRGAAQAAGIPVVAGHQTGLFE